MQLTVLPIFEPSDEERQQRYYVGFQMPQDDVDDTVNRLTELLSGGVMLCSSPVVTEQQERDGQPGSTSPRHPASTPRRQSTSAPRQPASTPPRQSVSTPS